MAMTGKVFTPLACTTALALTMLAVPAAAQQRVEVGNAASIVGEARISNAQIRDPRPLARRERIAWGDNIETGRESQMQILLLDRSTFGIGPRARVRIDSFVYDPNAGRSILATITRGALRFFSGRQEGTNSAEITSPAGRIGIRGTAIDMLVGDRAENIAEDEPAVGNVRSNSDEATLVILRGPGAGTLGGLTVGRAEVTAAGVTVTLDRPGTAAYVPRNGAPPIGPFQISDAGLGRVMDRLAPAVAEARSGGGLLDALLPVAAIGAAVGAAILLTDDNSNGNTAGTTNDRGTADKGGPVGTPGYPNGPTTGGTQNGINVVNPGTPTSNAGNQSDYSSPDLIYAETPPVDTSGDAEKPPSNSY